MSNPYKVLGINPSMSEEEAKKAYRNLCRKHHTDAGGESGKIQEITVAWEELQSYKKRGLKPFGRGGSSLTHKTLFTFRRL